MVFLDTTFSLVSFCVPKITLEDSNVEVLCEPSMLFMGDSTIFKSFALFRGVIFVDFTNGVLSTCTACSWKCVS